MNNSIKTLLLLTVSLGLFSCSKSEEEEPQKISLIPIQVETDMEGYQPETRTTIDGLQVDDITTFYMYIEDPTDPAFTYQVEMIKYGSEWKAVDIDTRLPVKLYFKDISQPVHVKAVFWYDALFKSFVAKRTSDRWTAPYNILVSKTYTGIFRDLEANDPVYANTTIIPKQDCPDGKLHLSFKHLFAKVKLSLQLNSLYTWAYQLYGDSPIQNLKVSGVVAWENISRYPNWVLGSDEISIPEGYPTSTISFTRWLQWESFEGLTHYVMMAIPQSIADNSLKVSFQLDNVNYIWTCQEKNLRFERNREYDIKLNIISPLTKSAIGNNPIEISGTLQKGGKL